MKLLTQEIVKRLPELQDTAEETDPIVHCKFFLPGTGWKWYAIEFDGKDMFYGYVVGLERELGYFSLSELESIQGPFLMHVERDLYFKPKHLSRIR